MKNKIQQLLVVTTSILAFVVSFTTVVNASTFSFSWAYKTNGLVDVKASPEYLSSDYNGTVFDEGIDKWNASKANVIISEVSRTASKVDLYTVSRSQWNDNGWGSGEAWAQGFSGTTPCTTTPVFTNPEDKCANSLINYGAVYTNDSNVSFWKSRREALIAHEIGHIIGLKHTSLISAKSDSIMTANLEGGYDVSSYDEGEVNYKYR
ncbi:zinc metalloprotease [Chengkuizengella marina]|nr:hypothetical protein [Chengkuizengella marina]